MALPQQRPLTVADYLAATDDSRWELIEGVVYDMAPAPVLRHQALALGVGFWLKDRIPPPRPGDGGGDEPPGCRVFVAPVDVVLGPSTVVQPDVVVVCDPAKLANGHYVDGAPDLVVEILSPRTAKKDRLTKRLAYQAAGVPEYLIIDPAADTVEQFLLENGIYPAPNVFAPGDALALRLLPEVEFPLDEWFAAAG